MNNNDIAQIVINWYKKENFAMPWRINSNPYKIWISEIMLQQTQVNTVIPFYIKWLKRFPTINLLANAKIDDVLKCWEGLGYYSRAHNLHNTAKEIVNKHSANLPNNYSDLKKLIMNDKKVKGGNISLILLKGIGLSFQTQKFNFENFKKSFS